MAEQLELKLQKEKPKKKSSFDRRAYLSLTDLTPGWGLCIHCKYSWFSGSACDCEMECHHPLPVINGEDDGERPYEVWAGDRDCWGFRPERTLQEVGVFVGIILEGHTPHQSNTFGELIAIIPSENDKAEGL